MLSIRDIFPDSRWLGRLYLTDDKESAEQIVSQPLQYVQIASSKFLSAINPLETPLLQLFIRLEETEEHLFKLQAEGICNGKEFIKLKATLMTNSKKTHSL